MVERVAKVDASPMLKLPFLDQLRLRAQALLEPCEDGDAQAWRGRLSTIRPHLLCLPPDLEMQPMGRHMFC